MTKWDTIQADVQDQYAHLEEEEAYMEAMGEDEDFFGFAKSIELDHLTDEQLDEVFNMFGDK